MEEKIKIHLKEQNILVHKNHDILVCTLQTQTEGFRLAKDILYAIVDRNTALYLSGGRTPKELYKKLAEEKKLLPRVVGLVDERFGEPMHEKSNELLLKETGLLAYLHDQHVKFYPMLHTISRHSRESGNRIPGHAGNDEIRKGLAEAYDDLFRSLNATYQKSVAILGIGLDGHTAGLPVQNSKFKMQSFDDAQDRNAKFFNPYDLVTEYDDAGGFYGERITMTFLGLSMIDVLVVLVFGADKKDALEKMFEEGKEEEIPSRFFKRPDIAKKTIIITDQNI